MDDMNRFTHEEKRQRNKALIMYRKEHPNKSLSDVALAFNITRQRVTQILHCEDQKRWYRSGGKQIKQKVQRELRVGVLTHYGKGRCACVGCGESRLACLTIDHIHGWGNQHRKKSKRYGYSFYAWLRRNNYPKDYQTLCMNCQFVKMVLDKSHEGWKEDRVSDEVESDIL